jgi:hypothetical protein
VGSLSETALTPSLNHQEALFMTIKSFAVFAAVVAGALAFGSRADAQIVSGYSTYTPGNLSTSYYTPVTSGSYYTTPAYYTTPYQSVYAYGTPAYSSSYYYSPYSYSTGYYSPYGSYYGYSTPYYGGLYNTGYGYGGRRFYGRW